MTSTNGGFVHDIGVGLTSVGWMGIGSEIQVAEVIAAADSTESGTWQQVPSVPRVRPSATR
jgi:hypothetical protein